MSIFIGTLRNVRRSQLPMPPFRVERVSKRLLLKRRKVAVPRGLTPLGLCEWMPNRRERKSRPSYFRISLWKGIPDAWMQDILLHECAHALMWELSGRRARTLNHGPRWALAFAKLYRLAVGEK